MTNGSVSKNVDIWNICPNKTVQSFCCCCGIQYPINSIEEPLVVSHLTSSLLFSKAKVNNNSQVGVAYTQRLRDGIKLTLSSLIDTKNLNQGGHKIGLGLDMEAWEVGSELFSYNKTTTEWSSVYWNLVFFSFSVRKLLLYRANALRAKICVKSGMHAIDLFWINFKVTCCFLIPSVVLWIFWYC